MIRLLSAILSILTHLLIVFLLTIRLHTKTPNQIPSVIRFHLEPSEAIILPGFQKAAIPVEQLALNAPSQVNADTLFPEESPLISMRNFRGELHPSSQKDDVQPTPDDSVSLIRERVQSWFASASREGAAMQSVNHLSSAWTNKVHESVPMASQNPPKEKKPKVHTPAFDFIPSPIQAEMLRILFKGSEMSLQDLYTSIADTFSCTQESIAEELALLYHHGIIRERKVVLKPPMLLFGISVETNSISRKNTIYYYQANIKKEIFLDYLQSLISRFSVQDSLSIKTRRRMETCLLLLSGGS